MSHLERLIALAVGIPIELGLRLLERFAGGPQHCPQCHIPAGATGAIAHRPSCTYPTSRCDW